jgi:hypothetical protein
MTQHNLADTSASVSILSAVITISTIQPLVSLTAGLVAIVSGLFAIRYYYYKTKNIKKDGNS